MFRGIWGRVVAIIVVTALIGGCAEFDQRGGVVAEVGDFVLSPPIPRAIACFEPICSLERC
jgi:hypothetical protein